MKKMIKIHYGVISRQNSLEKANEVRKEKLSFRFVPTQSVIENKLKDRFMASFQAKIGWKRPRKRKNKNCLFVPFLPDR